MEHDQEVVREPFDDGESVVSVELSCDDNNHHEVESRRRNSLNIRHSSSDRRRHSIDRSESNYQASLEQNGQVEEDEDNNDDDDNDDSSHDEADPASHEKDAKFAKKFGIELKRSRPTRGELAEKLLKSGQLDATQNKPPQNGVAPMLKTSTTSDCIYHKGTFYQKGDIVALRDQDDGQVYFAQLTGFLQDQYCEKSASLTWLVPTRATSRDFFDPAAYRIGLEDSQLRKLDCVTFVRHCPHDYYLRKLFQAGSSSSSLDQVPHPNGQPLLNSRSNKEKFYIWTTMEPCLVPPIVSE